MACMVELRGVDLAFGTHQVFRGLDLEVPQGEVLTILGGSGSGKSVLLKMILRLIRWQAGQVFIDGEDITNRPETEMLPVRRKVGMVFQHGALFDSMSARDNVAYPLRERGNHTRDAIDARVAEVLGMVGLPDVGHKMPAELSGGMRKRVALARAIAELPKVLLYDEPTTGLDPINVRRISELILQLNRQLGMTSIVVTHDLPSAYMISDRIAMVGTGRILAIGTPDELQQNDDPSVHDFLTAMHDAPSAAR